MTTMSIVASKIIIKLYFIGMKKHFLYIREEHDYNCFSVPIILFYNSSVKEKIQSH